MTQLFKYRFMAKIKVNADPGCWDWTALKIWNGYGQIRRDGKMQYAHRVSFELYREPIPQGMQVLHTCDNRGCVNPQHLFLGTNADNVADKVAKGRQSRVGARVCGTANGNAKLTEVDVRAIRASVGMTQQKLADKFGVDSSVISKILSKEIWGHVMAPVQEQA